MNNDPNGFCEEVGAGTIAPNERFGPRIGVGAVPYPNSEITHATPPMISAGTPTQ